MEEVVSDAKKAIQKQQAKEVENLKQKFADPDFKDNLKMALNITDEQIDDVQKSMLSNLQETQKKQIEEFDKANQESLKTLHGAAAKQRQAFLFIASLAKNDEQMRRQIEELAIANQKPTNDQNLQIEANDEEKPSISSVNLDQLKFIQLIGGGKINRAEGQPVSYSLELGARIKNLGYYVNDRHKRDMQVMAMAVRASGSEGISMKLKFKDEKLAEERARQAFEACLNAGFPPEKIKIHVNGQALAYKASDKDDKNGPKYESIQEKLYAKKPNEFNHLIQKAQKTRSDLEAALKNPSGSTEGMNAIKREMQELKRLEQQKPQTAPENDQRTGLSV
jgi:hypothetical protein